MRLVAHTDVLESSDPSGKEPGEDITQVAEEKLQGTEYVLEKTKMNKLNKSELRSIDLVLHSHINPDV